MTSCSCNFICDPNCTRVVRDLALIIYGEIMSKSLFVGLRTINEICSEECIWHPIKAHLCQKTIWIDINHFYHNFVHFTNVNSLLFWPTNDILDFTRIKRYSLTIFYMELLIINNQRQIPDPWPIVCNLDQNSCFNYVSSWKKLNWHVILYQ